MEGQVSGDIDHLIGDHLERYLSVAVGKDIKQSTYKEDSQEPVLIGNTKPIQNIVRHTFDVLDLAFSRILMLEIRFRLSILNTVETQDVVYFNRGLLLGAVTDEALHGSVLADKVNESTRKLGLRTHGVTLAKFGL